jgi:HEAT repeat protein
MGRNASEVLPILMKALGTEDQNINVREVFVSIGSPSIPFLIGALSDESDYVRRNAVLMLDSLNGSETLPALEQAFHEGSPLAREAAAKALINLKIEAVPFLIQMVKDEDEELRILAIETLGDIGPDAKEAIPAVIEARKTEANYSPLVEAIDSFMLFMRKAAVPALVETLKDEADYMRSWAVFNLGIDGYYAPDKSVPALIDALDDENYDIRYEVVQALSRLGPSAREAIPELIEALRGKYGVSISASSVAYDALKAITGEDFGKDSDRWQEWYIHLHDKITIQTVKIWSQSYYESKDVEWGVIPESIGFEVTVIDVNGPSDIEYVKVTLPEDLSATITLSDTESSLGMQPKDGKYFDVLPLDGLYGDGYDSLGQPLNGLFTFETKGRDTSIVWETYYFDGWILEPRTSLSPRNSEIVTSNGLTFSWDNMGFQDFEVRVGIDTNSPTGSNYSQFLWSRHGSQSEIVYDGQPLTDGEYWWALIAYDSVGNSVTTYTDFQIVNP